MARPEILLETGTNELEILELFIDETDPVSGSHAPSYFGVNVAKVMQVIESPDLAVPEAGSHASFMGTISLRGKVVPIVDLSVLLRIEKHPHPWEVVVIVEFSQSVTGLLVSNVTDIFRVGWKEVMPPDHYLGSMVTGCLIGMIQMEDHFVQLLDLESILAELDPSCLEKAALTPVRARQQYRALVADDSATIRLMLQKLLGAANFSTTIVNNGAEALKYLEKLQDKAKDSGASVSNYLDIIIADIEMPLMDGFHLTKRIKENEWFGDLPVILYSSLITDELFHKGVAVRADDQISKPEMDQMAERAIKLIEERQ